MVLKKAALIALALGVVIIIVAGLFFGIKLMRITSWPHFKARVSGATPVTLPGSDEYGIRMDLVYKYNGKKTATLEAENVTGPFHEAAALADKLNRAGTVPIIINPDKTDEMYIDRGIDLDTYKHSLVIACAGGIVLTVSFILMIGVFPRQMFYVFLAMGIISLLITVPALFLSGQRFLWPSVSAKIEGVDIVGKTDSKGRSKFAPRAQLSYEVFGKEYRSLYVGDYTGRTDFGPSVDMRVQQWNKKKRMDVQYNPKNPYEIGTDPGFLCALIPLGAGIVLIGCARLSRKQSLKG